MVYGKVLQPHDIDAFMQFCSSPLLSKFKTFGCGSAIASSSVATEWVKGKSLDEVLSIKNRLVPWFVTRRSM